MLLERQIGCVGNLKEKERRKSRMPDGMFEVKDRWSQRERFRMWGRRRGMVRLEGGEKEGMRIENVYRIRRAELGQSGLVGGSVGHEACDQSYVKSHIVLGFFGPAWFRGCDKNTSNSTGGGGLESHTHVNYLCLDTAAKNSQHLQICISLFFFSETLLLLV